MHRKSDEDFFKNFLSSLVQLSDTEKSSDRDQYCFKITRLFYARHTESLKKSFSDSF